MLALGAGPRQAWRTGREPWDRVPGASVQGAAAGGRAARADARPLRAADQPIGDSKCGVVKLINIVLVPTDIDDIYHSDI